MSISMNLFLQDRTAGRPKIVFFSTYHIKLLRTNTHWSLKTEEKMFKFYSLFQNSGIKVLSPNCLSINVSYIYETWYIWSFLVKLFHAIRFLLPIWLKSNQRVVLFTDLPTHFAFWYSTWLIWPGWWRCLLDLLLSQLYWEASAIADSLATNGKLNFHCWGKIVIHRSNEMFIAFCSCLGSHFGKSTQLWGPLCLWHRVSQNNLLKFLIFSPKRYRFWPMVIFIDKVSKKMWKLQLHYCSNNFFTAVLHVTPQNHVPHVGIQLLEMEKVRLFFLLFLITQHMSGTLGHILW